jgi:uncharacterized coiled-coil protein SlyX
MTVQDLLPFAQFALTIGNLGIMVYALTKFIAKPHNTLEARVIALEAKTQEFERIIVSMKDNITDEHETNEVMQTCMLALIDFEIQYCTNTHYEVTDDLMEAKKILRKHLGKK